MGLLIRNFFVLRWLKIRRVITMQSLRERFRYNTIEVLEDERTEARKEISRIKDSVNKSGKETPEQYKRRQELVSTLNRNYDVIGRRKGTVI